jgi:hypothetical protein
MINKTFINQFNGAELSYHYIYTININSDDTYSIVINSYYQQPEIGVTQISWQDTYKIENATISTHADAYNYLINTEGSVFYGGTLPQEQTQSPPPPPPPPTE